MTCVICGDEDWKGRDIIPHGHMCRSCSYAFFCMKRRGKWLRAVP